MLKHKSLSAAAALTVLIFGMSVESGAITPPEDALSSYYSKSYFWIKSYDKLQELPEEEIPNGRIINAPDYAHGYGPELPESAHFTEVFNLSEFKKPVLRSWRPSGFYASIYSSSYFVAVPGGHCAISDLTSQIEFPDLLPAISSVKLGFVDPGGYGAHGNIYTIGELPENKEDVEVVLTMTLVKGFIRDEESDFPRLEPVPSANGEWEEAEVSYTGPGLSSLGQAYVEVVMLNDVAYVNELTDGGGCGEFICRAKTPAGEVPMIYAGPGNNDDGGYRHMFLLPDNTESIILRWRAPAGAGCTFTNGTYFGEKTSLKFCSKAVQPGYEQEPTLGYSIADLVGSYDEPTYDGIDLQQTTDIMTGLNSDLGYDFDGNGILNWYYYNRYVDKFGIVAFQEGLGGSKLVKEYSKQSIGENVVFKGFTPLATTDKIVGYNGTGKLYGIDSNFEISLLNSADKKYDVALIDMENDGNPDFLYTEDNSVVTIGADGSAVTSRLNTMTREEYYKILPPGKNPLGSGVSFEGGPTREPAVFGSFSQVDINGDGYPDFINPASGKYYMNLGNGTYVIDDFGGTLLFRDFDGDGISDFLVYDPTAKSFTLCLQRTGDGQEAVVRTLISGYAASADVWCKDFDGDGDIDILMPLSTGDMSLLVMFENDGTGTFKKREYPVEGTPEFAKCIDWDADGKYEVVTHGAVDKENYPKPVAKFASYKINGLTVETEPEYLGIHSSDDSYVYEIMDVNNSGSLQWLVGSGGASSMFSPKDAGVNSRPSKPAAPQLNFDEASGELTVSWLRGSDKETPAADLTYELSIGTLPGAGDIVRPSATATGLRRAATAGNCGYELKRKFNTASWPQGKIYVTLQVVDDAGLGSEFSEAAVITKRMPAAAFALERPAGVAAYDEVVAKVTSVLPAGATVEWDFGDNGIITSQSAAEARGYFRTMGANVVKMTVTGADGVVSVATNTIDVKPVRVEAAQENLYAILAVDVDLDGKPELFNNYDGTHLYEGDEQGNYKKVNRLFNTQSIYNPTVIDANNDGLPDIYYDGGILINEGDKTMDNRTPDNFVCRTLYPDLDNDGYRDTSTSDYLGVFAKNSGDYVTFIETETEKYNGVDCKQVIDINGDGLPDLYNSSAWYENLGNFKFSEHKAPEGVYYEWACDFDSDGKADFVCKGTIEGGYGFFILWSDGSRTELGLYNNYYRPSIAQVRFDYDNNGCPDLIIYGADSEEVDSYRQRMLMFNADRTYEEVPMNDLSGQYVPYMRTDGKVGVRGNIIHCAPNEVPSAPANVRASVIGQDLVIEWDAATDKETPSAALRYNLSVKRKGAEGDGAYLISPLNGGVDGVSVPTDAYLLSSTRIAIPLISVAKGEYEIKVQAVDGRREAGNFSAPAYCKVSSAGYLAPKETMVNSTVTITFSADINLSDVDYGEGAQIEKNAGQTVYVYWTTEGVKTISAPGLSFEILVHPQLSAYFSLPETVAYRSQIHVYADMTHGSKFYTSRERKEFGLFEAYVECNVEVLNDSEALITLPYSVATYKVKHELEEPWGSDVWETLVDVRSYPEPEIGIVDIDDATGKYCVRMSDFTTDVVGYELYRETPQAGEYEVIASGLDAYTAYVDMDSDPKEHPSRYALKNIFSYGYSYLSKGHQPIHVQVNAGLNGEWNLAWNKYEGREASTYRILRGSDAASLECIAEVSGNTTSYSDYGHPGGTLYYAVETLIAKSVAPAAAPSRAVDEAAMWRSRSNTVDVTASDISEAVAEISLSVSSDARTVRISGTRAGNIVEVYSLAGARLYRGIASDGTTILDLTLAPDIIYLIKVGDYSVKYTPTR